MPKLLPSLYDGFLKTPDGYIKADSPEWFDWLRENRGFAVDMTGSRVTFRAERRGNKEFWYAMRRVNGKLHRRYAGHTGTLFNHRVTALANELALCDSGCGEVVTQEETPAPPGTDNGGTGVSESDELARLTAEIERLQSANDTLARQCSERDETIAELRAKIIVKESHKESHKETTPVRSAMATEKLTYALTLPANKGGAIKVIIREVLDSLHQSE